MAHIRGLLANAHRMLSEPIVQMWPDELLQIVDAMVVNMPEGASPPALPCTPFRKLRVVFDVMGQGAKDIQFWDGDCMLLSIQRKPFGGRLSASSKLLYVAWRCRLPGNRRRLLDECALMCGIELGLAVRNGGELMMLRHRNEVTGLPDWQVWPSKKGMGIARKGHGTRVVFVDPVSREY